MGYAAVTESNTVYPFVNRRFIWEGPLRGVLVGATKHID